MKRIVLLIAIFIFLFSSCKKEKGKETLKDPITGKDISIKVKRFEDLLFVQGNEGIKQRLKDNYEDYKYLFYESLDNDEYFSMIESFVKDTNIISAYNVVKKRYPNLEWLEDDITKTFSNLLEVYPNLKIPKIYSLIFGPSDFSFAYAQRVIANKDFMCFAIDLYSINSLTDNKYYSHFPKYISSMLDSNFILPDMMNLYLRNALTPKEIPIMETSPDASFCDIIIERGKYLYVLKEILPDDYSLNSLFRYTEQEMQWVKENEYNIWGLIVQNNLLYSKDRVNYMNLVNEGPTTRGIKNSPARLGDYIGYRIVENYAKETKKGIKEILEGKETAKDILNKSSYKPKK